MSENELLREAAEEQALLVRLSALETDTPTADEEQLQALYRRALQKAGLADAPMQDTEQPQAQSHHTPQKTGPAGTQAKSKKKAIRWRSWVLSAAAVLAVMVLGRAALMTAIDDLTSNLIGNVHSVLPDGDDFPSTKAPGWFADTSTETTVQESAIFDALLGDTEDAAPEESVEESVEEPAEAPDSGTAAEGSGTLPDRYTGQELLLMADGRLYRATALTVEPVEDGDRTACIETVITVIPADETPAENGQANFDAKGAPYVLQRNGVAVLLDGVWVFFEPVE